MVHIKKKNLRKKRTEYYRLNRVPPSSRAEVLTPSASDCDYI